MAISQRRVHYERLRSSICTCTWGNNDIDPFSLFSFLFLRRLFLVGMSMGHFHFDTPCADILCLHTSAITLLANVSQASRSLHVTCQSWELAERKASLYLPFSIAPKKTCLISEKWHNKSFDQLVSSFRLIESAPAFSSFGRNFTGCDIKHYYFLFGNGIWSSGRNCISQLATCN